jgi:hypothetical protein
MPDSHVLSAIRQGSTMGRRSDRRSDGNRRMMLAQEAARLIREKLRDVVTQWVHHEKRESTVDHNP